MLESDSAQSRATATYDASADSYDDPFNTFWSRFGRRTIERLNLKAGDRVLDVCCGSGASALPAADRVGPTGLVLGLDLSQRLLALARAKAHAKSLANVEFRVADATELDVESMFDAVVCVFGIFFLPDMPAAIRSLWRAVRPGGQLAVTTWGPRFLEPASTAFWNSIREVEPHLYKGFNPWDRITVPQDLLALLHEGGVDGAVADPESGWHPIPTPEAWWAAVKGSGYRGTIEQLVDSARERVRDMNLAFIRDAGVEAVEANVVYAHARKPAS
jgi:ubiquinone/menaquinone biosynthesis C-methylase UbiE